MVEKNMALAEAYYRAMNNKDISGMGRYFHPTIEVLGPLAEVSGKETVLEIAEQRLFPLFNTLTIRAKFGAANQVVIVYDLECVPPIGILRIAALLTFKDELISRVELFFDARPFEKEKDDISSGGN